MDKSLTAEEKLLRIIRRKPEVTARTQDGFSSDAGKRNSPDKNDSNMLSWVNKILVMLSFAAVGFLVFQYLNPPQPKIITIESEVQASAEPSTVSSSVEAERPLSDYLNTLDQRNIFEMPWEKVKPVVETAPVVDVALPKLNELIRVSGIMLDKNPQAIIEDLGTNQTVFLTIGQVIKDATVEQILEDKVVFSYHGQKVEINK